MTSNLTSWFEFKFQFGVSQIVVRGRPLVAFTIFKIQCKIRPETLI